TLKMPAFEWVHVQLHQQKGMISLSLPTICNSATQRRNEQCIPCHNTLFRDAVSGRPVLTRQQRMKSL
ncbi:hypothetical protein, partial [Citrobacter freundii]|uniref:hypothetical protein n=1 Tax=Citrobacter freundii TaxID=546 RepID=UPI001EE69C4F